MKYLIFIILLLLAACRAVKNPMDVVGEFRAADPQLHWFLQLNSDSSFFLKLRAGHMSTPQCKGRWYYLAKDTLFLQCNPADWNDAMSRGYMSQRENKVKIFSYYELELDGKVLKRIKKRQK